MWYILDSSTCIMHCFQSFSSKNLYGQYSRKLVIYLPPTNDGWVKVIFSQASVCPQDHTPSLPCISGHTQPPGMHNPWHACPLPHMVPGHACPLAMHAPGKWADCMNPTGMHSCFTKFSVFSSWFYWRIVT